ncbi:hypothetical protein L7F22_010199 [Adiantum nelumboides]|nr:hypothetical protein [Adiantum nelumboides]
MRRVPRKEEIYKALEETHEGSRGGHFASKITLHKILQEGYVWPSIQRDVHHWCKSCKECQSMASRVLRSEIRGTILAYDVFEKWGIDAIGPLPITARGKCYILTAVDYLSRWVEAKSVKQIISKDVAKFVYEDICCKFGMPLELLSDKGPGFRGELVDYLCEKLHVRHRFTTPYYPQCNGMNERFNGELIRMLTKMTQSNVKTWDLELLSALWAYRTAIKTGTGFSPFHLFFGKEALLPIEVEIPALKMMLKFEEANHDALKERLLYLQCLQLDRALALEHYEQILKTSQAKVKDKGIKKGDMVLRYNSKLDSTFQKKVSNQMARSFSSAGQVELKQPRTFEEAVEFAKNKEWKAQRLSQLGSKIEPNIEVKVVEQPRILTKEPRHDQQVAHDVDTFRKEMQEVVGIMKNLSVHMMGGGRGQGYGYGRGYGSNECFAGGRGRGMAVRRDMFQCYNCGEWGHKNPQCDKPKRMGGDMFPLPSQIPCRAQDYGIEIKGKSGPSGLTAEENGKTKGWSRISHPHNGEKTPREKKLHLTITL